MDIDLNNIDFAIAVNTFHDDIQDKIQLLNKMQLEFLRKFQHRVKISEHHSQMIFEIRKIVSNIQQMFKDIKDYFGQMKVGFVYDFVRKVQTLMVIGYNHLSQALLITFDMYEQQKIRQKQTKDPVQCTCKTKNDYILSKDQFKRLQHIDYTITNIQSQQQRLLMEMQTIYDRMMMQKGLIQKVKPSLVTKELEQMKDHIQTVMENNERLFEQTYMLKFFEFHNHINKLDKPEKINEVYNKINDNLKDNFVKQTLKAADRIQRGRRHNQENMISVEVQTCQLPRAKSRRQVNSNKQPTNSSLMKQTQSSHTSQFTLTKQRKLNQKLSIQLNHLQKQNSSLNEQLNSYKFAQKQIQIKYRQLVQKFSIVEQMYKKARSELEEIKDSSKWTIEKLEIQNKRIKQEIAVLRGKAYTQTDLFVSIQTQTDRIVKKVFNSNRSSMSANEYDEIVFQEKQCQTMEEYLIPNTQNQVVKLLKSRNQKAIIMLNQKDKKIRESMNKVGYLEDQTKKIKSNLNMFVGIVEENFRGVKKQEFQQNRNETNLDKQGKSRKRSILQMNSYQISQKIRQILKLIVPNINEQQSNQIQTKFKKLNSSVQNTMIHSLKIRRNQTLQDNQQLQYDEVNQLPSGGGYSNQSGFKTLNNLKVQNWENKKNKRLSVLNLLSTKRNNIQQKDLINQFTQTQDKDNLNYNTRSFQTQTVIDENFINTKVKQSINRSSIQVKQSKVHNYQKPLSIRKKKQTNSNRNSQTALSQRQKSSQFMKNLNTFQKIKMQDSNKIGHHKIFNDNRKSLIEQAVLNNRKKMVATTSFSHRKDAKSSLQQFTTQTQSIFTQKNKNLSPFKNKQDLTIGRLSSLLDDSLEMQFDKLKSKYPQKQNMMGTETFNSGFSYYNKENNFSKVELNNAKYKMKKHTHHRLVSEMTSNVKLLHEIAEEDEKNIINIAYCPNNTFSNGLNTFKDTIKNNFQGNEKKINMQTLNQRFFGGNSQRSVDKKKTLLLSIQKYKSENNNISDSLLLKYLTKVIQKWGKQKVKDSIIQLTNHPNRNLLQDKKDI